MYIIFLFQAISSFTHGSNQIFSSFSVAQFHFSTSVISICLLSWLISLPSHVQGKASGKTSSIFSSIISSTFSEDDTFIINLINQEEFSECSVMVLQDRFDNGHSVDRIIESVTYPPFNMRAAYSIKYTFPRTCKSGDPLPIRFPISVFGFRRRSDPCLMVILMVNDLRPEFIHQIYNMLTPVYIPITRKDEDFYIFKTEPKHHEKLLLMQELPNRIKFKIAVGLKTKQTGEINVCVSTVCFFCEAGGKPRLLQLPVTHHNMPVAGTNYFPDFVWNLNGKLLRVSFPYIRAKVEADAPWEGTSNARRGHWKYLFERYLMVKMNFTYNMFASTGKDGRSGGGGTGLQLENGTWIGVTGDIVSGKADIGIVVANTDKRIHYIDYSTSYIDAGSFTFVTAPATKIFSPAALLWPFDLGMWSAIGAATLFSIIFFSASIKLMEVLQFNQRENWSLRAQVQFLLSTYLEQDSDILPDSHSMRTFVALWFCFTMIVITLYRSKMVELLAFPVLGKLPKTFEDLVYSDYKIGFMKHGDSGYNTLAASNDPVYVKLVAEMEIFRGVGLECLEKVVKYKYGCIAYDFALVHLRERNLSETDTKRLVFAPARTYNVWLSLGTEGKSIYRINFGKMLIRARQAYLPQIYEREDMYYNVRLPKREWWESTGQMDKAKHEEEGMDNLTLKHILGAFYVLFGLLSISTIAFLIECMTFHKERLYFWFCRMRQNISKLKTALKTKSTKIMLYLRHQLRSLIIQAARVFF